MYIQYIYIYTELNILWPLLYLSTILSEKHIPWGWPPPASKLISNWCKLCLLEGGSGWSLLSSFLCVHKAIFRGLVNFIIPDMMWVKQNSKTQKQFQQHRVVQNIFEIIWRYFLVSFAPGEETRDQSGLTRWIFVLSPKAKTVLMFKQRSWKHIWLKHRCGPVQRSQVALLALWQ